MKKLEPDDPKLTAYALGELDEGERQKIEAQLAGNEEARKTVREVREIIGYKPF